MKLRNDASIVRALISLADAFDDVAGHGRVTAGVLSRAPGDGAPLLLRNVAHVLGLETLVLRAANMEDDPHVMDVRVDAPIRQVVEIGKPVLVVIDEAHSAPRSVVRKIASATLRAAQAQPCLVVAICTSPAERVISEEIAEGLERNVAEIAMHRTADENQRLMRRIVEAMG